MRRLLKFEQENRSRPSHISRIQETLDNLGAMVQCTVQALA